MRDAAAAGEVVQAAWLAALESIDRFEGRSSLRTWLYGILVNVARAHAGANGAKCRCRLWPTPRSADGAPRVAPIGSSRKATNGLVIGGDAPAFPGPDQALERRELRRNAPGAIAELPVIQQQIIVLCDVRASTGEEACNILGVTGTHQRVLLHRARSKVRAALERRLTEAGT